MRVLNEANIADAISAYTAGASFKTIGSGFGVSGVAIRGLLSRRGIESRASGESRRFAMNQDFFFRCEY